jgi:hypothetical protein
MLTWRNTRNPGHKAFLILLATDSKAQPQVDQEPTKAERIIDTTPQTSKHAMDFSIEQLIVFVTKHTNTLIRAMLFDTLSAMEDHKRKKRAENQTASIVKQTGTLNIANCCRTHCDTRYDDISN